ncbi:MAG: site-specific integrase [Nitrospirae bacterium]|nr:site-specific integrase [Nitrospirota bacterium]
MKTLKRILNEVLPSLPLAHNAKDIINIDWNRIWKACLDSSPSYRTRQRFKALLVEIAERWHEAKLIADIPDFAVPPQHQRRGVLSVSKLQGYRYSDYRQLIAFIVQIIITGFEQCPSVTPKNVSELSTWLALLLICSGVCQHAPLESLLGLKWGDVLALFDPNVELIPLIRLPRRKRRGYMWLRLSILVWLFLLALAFRQKRLTEFVFDRSDKQLDEKLRQLLERLCERAGAPSLRPSQLIHFVRLDLLQILPNLNLAVLTGQIPFAPMPADQVYEQQTGKPPTESLRVWDSGNGLMPALVDDCEVIDSAADDTTLWSMYDEALTENAVLTSHLESLFHSTPHRVVKQLEKWCNEQDEQLSMGSNVPRFNVLWLVQWLLDMTRDRAIKPPSRGAYWAAVLRVLRLYPVIVVNQVDQNLLQEALEFLPGQTAKLTKTAWKRLANFLKRSGLAVPDIQWRRIKVSVTSQPVRILDERTFNETLNLLARPFRRALRAGRWLGLRVSEVCKLRCDDFDLTGIPYVIVPCSKRGRSRRISLDSLPGERLDTLRQYIEHQRKKFGADAPFIDDQGEPLDPEQVSSEVGSAFERIGKRGKQLEGLSLVFHAARKGRAFELYEKEGDVRHVSLELGHALPVTTVGSYLHPLDLQTACLMAKWDTPLNTEPLHLPLTALAILLGVDRSRIRQLIKEYSNAEREKKVYVISGKSMPNKDQLSGAALRAHYLTVSDAIRLLVNVLCKQCVI